MSQDSCDDEDNSAPPPEPIIEIPESRRAQDVADKHKKPSKFSSLRKLTCLNVTFNGILAITAIFLVISAIYQSCVMQRQWETMERTLTIDQRAWLTIRQPMLNSVLAVGENPSFYVRVQNSGKSPAMKVRSRVTFGIFDKLPEGPRPPEEPIVGEESRSLIAPGEYMRRPGELPVSLTQNVLDRLKRKELSIFMYGSLIYFDIFHVEHRTMFCLFLPDIAKTDLSPCSKWNDAD